VKRSSYDQKKRDFRAAVQIAAALQNQSLPDIGLAPLQEPLTAIAKYRKRFLQCGERGWLHGSRDSADRMHSAASTLSRKAKMMADEIHAWSTKPKQISASLIYCELAAIRKEFAVVEIDLAGKRIVVETDDIVLDEVFLGQFQICLKWKHIQQSSPYEVTNPSTDYASSSDGTTHPHVQSEKLCEGEGATVISRALKEGRLFDFFTVVDRILKTYNPDSAYTSLEDWGGQSCRDCGDQVNSEDTYACTKCENEICTDCSSACDSCSDRFCSDCISTCECCESDLCRYCQELCAGCDSYFCSSCLTDGMCDDCTDENNQAPETQIDPTAASLASVHTLRDGKTAIPA
jgi:hypothetical protein